MFNTKKLSCDNHLTLSLRDQIVHGKRTDYFLGIQFNEMNSLGNLVAVLSLQLLFCIVEPSQCMYSGNGNNDASKVIQI